MPLHLWVVLWLASGLVSWPLASQTAYGAAFASTLYGLGVLASCWLRRPALALVAAPLLYGLLMIPSHALPEYLWPLCVLLSLQWLGGGSLGAFLLCALTYAAVAQDLAWIGIGTAALFVNALVLGYLRSRERLDGLLEQAQRLSWMGLKAFAIAILVIAFLGVLIGGTGGSGVFVLFLLRGVWSGMKETKSK